MSIHRLKISKWEELQKLFTKVYPNNPLIRQLDHFNWQYLSEEKQYNFFVSFNKEGINGFIGYVPCNLWINGKIASGCMLQHWTSLPKDITGLRLLNKAVENLDNRLLLGLSSESYPICQSLKIPTHDSIERYVLILPSAAASKYFNHNTFTNNYFIDNSELSKTSVIEAVYRFDDDIDYSVLHNGNYANGVRRTGKYLNWRYIDIPSHQYKVFVSKTCPTMYCVLRKEQILGSDDNVVRITEWTFDKASSACALSYIIDNIADHQTILIDFYCTLSSLGDTMTKIGFTLSSNIKENIPALFRPLNYIKHDLRVAIDLPPHRRDRTIDIHQWYITKGDSDMDRLKV
tara:strand:- start:4020 stop:5057 length:1038 start_codon:yes stop_codon:yes gene_type:complete